METLALHIDLNEAAFETAANNMQKHLDQIAKAAEGIKLKGVNVSDKMLKSFNTGAISKAFRDLTKPLNTNGLTQQFAKLRYQISQGANSLKVLQNAFTSFSGFGASVGSLIGGGLGSLIGGAIGGGADLLVNAAKTLASILYDAFEFGGKVFMEASKLNLAYKYVGGGGAQSIGRNIRDDLANNVSQKSAFNIQEAEKLALPIYRVLGNDTHAVHNMFGAAADLSALNPEKDPTAIRDQLANVKQRGGITKRQLTGLGLTEETNIEFYKNLGKVWGISAAAAEKRASKTEQTQGASDQILDEIYRSILRSTGKSKLGAVGKEAGETLAGAWHKLLSVPEDILTQFAAGEEFLRPITDGIIHITDILRSAFDDPAIRDSIASVLDSIGEGLKTSFTAENIMKVKDFTAEMFHLMGDIFTVNNIKRVEDAAVAVMDFIEDLINIKSDFIHPENEIERKYKRGLRRGMIPDTASITGLRDKEDSGWDDAKSVKDLFNSKTHMADAFLPSSMPKTETDSNAVATKPSKNNAFGLELHAPINVDIHITGDVNNEQSQDHIDKIKAAGKSVADQMHTVMERLLQEQGVGKN